MSIVGVIGVGASLCTYHFDYKANVGVLITEMGALDSFHMESFH